MRIHLVWDSRKISAGKSLCTNWFTGSPWDSDCEGAIHQGVSEGHGSYISKGLEYANALCYTYCCINCKNIYSCKNTLKYQYNKCLCFFLRKTLLYRVNIYISDMIKGNEPDVADIFFAGLNSFVLYCVQH